MSLRGPSFVLTWGPFQRGQGPPPSLLTLSVTRDFHKNLPSLFVILLWSTPRLFWLPKITMICAFSYFGAMITDPIEVDDSFSPEVLPLFQ